MAKITLWAIKYKKSFTFLMLFIFLIGTLSIRGCSESNFSLSPDSRLPRWFAIPSVLGRNDVSVEISDYITLFGYKYEEFVLIGRDGKVLERASGQYRWHPETEKRFIDNKFPSYPIYSVVTVNGISEIIEQKESGDILYISDDPELIKEINQKK